MCQVLQVLQSASPISPRSTASGNGPQLLDHGPGLSLIRTGAGAVIVTGVLPGTPAARCGMIRRGDKLVRVEMVERRVLPRLRARRRRRRPQQRSFAQPKTLRVRLTHGPPPPRAGPSHCACARAPLLQHPIAPAHFAARPAHSPYHTHTSHDSFQSPRRNSGPPK